MRYNQPPGAPPGAPFVDGDPANAIEGSVVPAASIEYPQREIVAAIEAAGLVPDNADLTQLVQAILLLSEQPEDLSGVPVGAVEFFATPTAPAGWLKANGAAVGRQTYAELFAVVGTTFGAGNGATTFNLPDLRGEFLRGFDDARGVDAGRVFGGRQKGTLVVGDFDGIGSTAVIGLATVPPAAGIVTVGADAISASNYSDVAGFLITPNSGVHIPGVNPLSFGASRPRNVALLPCIKAFGAPVEKGLIDTTALANDIARHQTDTSAHGGGASLKQNGYQKLPSGLMIQWGSYVQTVGGVQTQTFTYAFPTACLMVFTSQDYQQNGASVVGATALSATTFRSNTGSGDGFYVFAVGY